jgi:hypothetical protein
VIYLVAGLCGLYLSVAAFLTSIHSPITFFMTARWIGTVLLLIAAVLPPTRTTNIIALVGSTITTVLLVYLQVRLVQLKLGLLHGTGRVVAFQPTMFDRVNRIVTKPILLLFLISSLASLVISALITLRLRNRNGSSPLTESAGKI